MFGMQEQGLVQILLPVFERLSRRGEDQIHRDTRNAPANEVHGTRHVVRRVVALENT
jgi:hypothetical protein